MLTAESGKSTGVRKKSSVSALVSRSLTSLKWAWSAARASARPAMSGSSSSDDRRQRHDPPAADVEALKAPERDAHREDRQREQQVHEVGEHRHDRQELGREDGAPDEAGGGHQRGRPFDQRGRQPDPRKEPADQEEGVRLGPGGARLEDDAEDEGVDREQQQRLDERPEEAEDRPAIARLQLTQGERGQQSAVPEDPGGDIDR